MRTISLRCCHCGITFEKPTNEVTRQRKVKGENTPFFCTISCGAIHNNAPRKIPVVTGVKNCVCGKTFETTTGATYCSRTCASLYSFSEHRRQVLLRGSLLTRWDSERDDHLEHIAASLRVREWNKYDQLHGYLLRQGIPHHFEYHLPEINRVFDLVLFDLNLLVEFDEPYHFYNRKEDRSKDTQAMALGWNVHRLNVTNVVRPFSIELILPLLGLYE